jgi:hypothetical protein
MQMCIYEDTYYHDGNLYKNSLHKYAKKNMFGFANMFSSSSSLDVA